MTWQQITAAYMPALVIMATVYIAAVSNNKRMDDWRTDLNERMDQRIDGLRGDISNGFRRLEERLERLEHPITRP
jgi:hypothetical protein